MNKHYKSKRKTNARYANRGMELESYLEQANSRYQTLKIALIKKRPTPIVVKEVDKEGKITRAVFGEKSTVDFDGIAFKRSIAFDAKETENKSFPLNNVEAHQREYLTDHQEQGGISFIIVRFSTIGETYILTIDQLNKWQHESLQGGRKSIPLDFFKTHCKQCKPGRNVPIDYLSCLEEEQTI